MKLVCLHTEEKACLQYRINFYRTDPNAFSFVPANSWAPRLKQRCWIWSVRPSVDCGIPLWRTVCFTWATLIPLQSTVSFYIGATRTAQTLASAPPWDQSYSSEFRIWQSPSILISSALGKEDWSHHGVMFFWRFKWKGCIMHFKNSPFLFGFLDGA